jgi:hypothetical protein
MRIKNPYPEGDPNREVFIQGVNAERERLLKLLELYHKRFGQGDIATSDTKMQINYMYEFVSGKEAL